MPSNFETLKLKCIKNHFEYLKISPQKFGNFSENFD